MLARSLQLCGVFQPIGGRECPVLLAPLAAMWRVSAYRRQGMSRPASAAYPNPADGGRECPVLLAPLVRILLSLAVNVGLFSAVCTYLACFSQSAGLFQPFERSILR